MFDTLFNFPISAARGFRERPVRWIAATVVVLAALAGAVYGLFLWLRPFFQ